MNYVKRTRILGHDVYFRLGKLRQLVGVNSTLEDGRHIIFWEFDNLSQEDAEESLRAVQFWFNLPTIHLLQASTAQSWHAYCFYACSLQFATRIVIQTRFIDWEWLALCMSRGHYTLRLTDKGQGIPTLAKELASESPETATIEDIASGVKYEGWQRKEAAHAR